MDPKQIAQLLSDNIRDNNGFLLEAKVPFICPKCPICGNIAKIDLEQNIVDAIRNYEFDDLDHGLDADTVLLIRSGVHPECYRKVGYVPSAMASDTAETGDPWKIGDLAYFGGYFDSKQRNDPPISEDR